jgi:hypothetical protein
MVSSTLSLLALLALDARAASLQKPGAGRADAAASLKSTTWKPPQYLVAPLNAVWNHTMATYSPKPDPLKFPNYSYNQVIANKGRINFCVRWDGKRTADAAMRKRIASALQVQTKKWMDVLVGFDGWPYAQVPVKVVGWAARSASALPGLNATAEGRYYADKDREGIPQCAERCGRFFHQNGQYSSCPGGADAHYDMSLWLTEGFNGGAGGDWGQRVGMGPFLSTLGSKDQHIFLHEMVSLVGGGQADPVGTHVRAQRLLHVEAAGADELHHDGGVVHVHHRV